MTLIIWFDWSIAKVPLLSVIFTFVDKVHNYSNRLLYAIPFVTTHTQAGFTIESYSVPHMLALLSGICCQACSLSPSLTWGRLIKNNSLDGLQACCFPPLKPYINHMLSDSSGIHLEKESILQEPQMGRAELKQSFCYFTGLFNIISGSIASSCAVLLCSPLFTFQLPHYAHQV